MILNGIDRNCEWRGLTEGRRVALLANSAACTADGRRTLDALLEQGVHVVQLFSPEHGFAGTAAAGDKVMDGMDASSGLPVCSLYGDHKAIPTEYAGTFDVLLADLPDVGVRYYTYADTLFRVMDSCARMNCPLVVLDRSSPLGKWRQGPILDMRFSSDVGCAPVPVRHGFSLGEYARFVQEHCGMMTDCKMHVVGYDAGGAEGFPDFGMVWRSPSPNLRSFEALCAYTGTCLFEGTNLSEGRGTEQPFLTVGAPFVEVEPVLEALQDVDGAAFENCDFMPDCSKFAGVRCHGVRIKVLDWRRFNGFECGLRMLDAIRRDKPDEFRFIPAHFDHLLGTDEYRVGKMNLHELLDKANEDCRKFEERVGK